MKLTIFIIFNIFLGNVYSQDITKDIYNYMSKEYLDNSINVLQKAPAITIQDIAITKLSELNAYGKYFKYSEELNKGYYIVTFENDKFYLYILKVNIESNNILKNMGDNSKSAINKNIVKDLLEYDVLQTDTYENAVLKNSSSYIDEASYIKNISQVSAQFPAVNMVWKPRIIVDKEIMNNLSNHVSGKILNRTITTSKLTTADNHPCQLYSDVTAATIVPYAGGSRAKVFTVDQNWNRIIWWDRDKNVCPNCVNFDFALTQYNPQSSYSLKAPRDITYGTMVVTNNGINNCNFTGKDTTYPLIIADADNNRIVKVNYTFKTYMDANNCNISQIDKDFNIRDETYSTISNLSRPSAVSFHPGTNASSSSDDIIWYTEGSGGFNLVAVNYNNGNELQRISQVYYFGVKYNVHPTRMSIYRSPDGQRNVMAFIDALTNSLYVVGLNTDGKFVSSTPVACSVMNFGSQMLKGLVVTSNNWGFDGATIWAVTNGGPGGCEWGQDCGYVSTLKVNFTGYLAVSTEYLASYWIGRSSDKSFVNIQNMHAQSGYVDLFTMEKWNETYGIRRYKPGIDLISQNYGSFCSETNRMNITIRLSNPCKMRITGEFSDDDGPYVFKSCSISGITPVNGMYTLPSGTMTLNVYVGISGGNLSPQGGGGDSYEDKVRVTMNMAPQDEDPNTSNNRVVSQIITGVGNCYGGGGGCPYVFVNDGDSLRQDNNILHRSELPQNIGNDITDKYKLNIEPKFNDTDSECTLQIKELSTDVSNFDRFQLKAVDHPINTELVITENNDLALYFPQFVINPTNASVGAANVTCSVAYDSTCDNIYGDSSYVLYTDVVNDHMKSLREKVLNTIRFTVKSVSKMFRTSKQKMNILDGEEIIDSIAIILDPQRNNASSSPINKTNDAGILVASNRVEKYNSGEKHFDRRENRSVIAVPVSKDTTIDSISTTWLRDYNLSFFCTTILYYGGFSETILNIDSAVSTLYGDILRTVTDKDGGSIGMDNTNTITLKFKNATDTVPKGWKRDYVLITDGQYTSGFSIGGRPMNPLATNNNLPKVFKLYQNYPNPFNPSSVIKYDLPRDSKVTIKIYDLLGREVKTLVNEFKQAGWYNTEFDGSNLASGVYFYHIEAGTFIQSKKMVLLK